MSLSHIFVCFARVCLVGLGFGLVSSAAQAQVPSPVGVWDGNIASPAGPVMFTVEVTGTGEALKAVLLNATDRIPFSSAAWNGRTLTLRLEQYDGTLTAHQSSPERMRGEYSRLTRNGVVHIPLTLSTHVEASIGSPSPAASLAGSWLYREAGGNGMDSTALLEIFQPPANGADRAGITGILEPVSGDSGLLHGWVALQAGTTHLHLSRFDGIHTMAMDGDLEPDGSLKGKFSYSTSTAQQFTASRAAKNDAVNPTEQAGTVTRVRDSKEPFRFAARDAQNLLLTQDSPDFKGKPLIIDIFGTWCPNCHDEAPVLEELYRKYHGQGLVVVGLAYEYTDDTARDLRQIGIYRDKYGITFPLLLAGTTDRGQIENTLPQVVGFGAFPTTIFVGRDGRVRSIHAGFEGPATGEIFNQSKDMLEESTRAIMAAGP